MALSAVSKTRIAPKPSHGTWTGSRVVEVSRFTTGTCIIYCFVTFEDN